MKPEFDPQLLTSVMEDVLKSVMLHIEKTGEFPVYVMVKYDDLKDIVKYTAELELAVDNALSSN